MATQKCLILLAFFVLTLAGGVIAYFICRISRIECYSETTACPPEVLMALNSVHGQSLFFFDGLQLDRALHDQPGYQVSDYQLWLPNTVKIQVRPQIVAYILRPEFQTASLAVTSDGKLTPNLLESTNTQVLVPDHQWARFEAGQTLDYQLHTLFLSTIRELQAAAISAPAIYLFDQQTLVLYLPDQPQVLIDTQQTTASIARLKSVLTELAINPLSASTKEIDVRYKLPVLRTSTSIPRHTAY